MMLQQKTKRKSIRLKEYDYSTPGYYFVTICTNKRKCLFGEITDNEMILNDAGKMVDKWFKEIKNKYPLVEIDEYIIMPNHFHGIIQIVGADLCVGPEMQNVDDCASNGIMDNDKPKKTGGHTGPPLQKNNEILPQVPEIVQWFKTMTTNEYIKNVKQNNWQTFYKNLWQRNYYEHVIRNDIDLFETRDYIIKNPKKWHLDKYNLEIPENKEIKYV